MSVFFVKDKEWWRYDFVLKKNRYTQDGFKTKAKAKRAEAKRKEDLERPKEVTKTQTDMDFLELVNRRLDFIKAYLSEKHYADNLYQGKKWLKEWGKLQCTQITADMIYAYLFKRSKVSHITANKDLINLSHV